MRHSIILLTIVVAILSLVGSTAWSDASIPLLSVDLTGKVVDSPIETDGPSDNEPAFVQLGLDAVVRSGPMSTNSLEIDNSFFGGLNSVQFTFLSGFVAKDGLLEVSMDLWFPELGEYHVYVSGDGVTGIWQFAQLNFYSDGRVEINDQSGSSQIIGTYSAATTIPTRFLFDMVNGTYDVSGGSFGISGRAHGIVLGALISGINQILIGPEAPASPGPYFGKLYVDNITVVFLPCCVGLTGNVDCDPLDVVDIADLTALIDHLFINFPPLCCPEEANIDGDAAGLVDIADLTALIDHLFINFTPTAPCQ